MTGRDPLQLAVFAAGRPEHLLHQSFASEKISVVGSISQLRSALRGLHALVVVGQTKSIAGAARALGVTPSAVSHLLSDLEGRLAVRLIERGHGSTALTEAGQALCRDAAPAFGSIEQALRASQSLRSRLRISTVSTFAMHWLVPRLSSAEYQALNIELEVGTDVRPLDLDLDGVDGAIRWGHGNWTSCHRELLFKEMLIAVAAPPIAATAAHADGLAAAPHIRAKNRTDDWSIWAAGAGLKDAKPPVPLVLETRSLAIGAALAGLGVIAIDKALIEAELRDGRLAQIGTLEVPRDEGYWLVWSKDYSAKPAFRAFRRWLIGYCRSAYG
jgi:LysR family glycine cleavage system transcriptional activator